MGRATREGSVRFGKLGCGALWIADPLIPRPDSLGGFGGGVSYAVRWSLAGRIGVLRLAPFDAIPFLFPGHVVPPWRTASQLDRGLLESKKKTANGGVKRGANDDRRTGLIRFL